MPSRVQAVPRTKASGCVGRQPGRMTKLRHASQPLPTRRPRKLENVGPTSEYDKARANRAADSLRVSRSGLTVPRRLCSLRI